MLTKIKITSLFFILSFLSCVDEEFSQTNPDIDLDTAQMIAEGFKKSKIESKNNENWLNCYIQSMIPYYDKNKIIQAYEAKILDKSGAPCGSIMVEAWDNYALISEYYDQGYSNADSLLKLFETVNHFSPKENEITFLWNGPESASMEYKGSITSFNEQSIDNFDHVKRLTLADNLNEYKENRNVLKQLYIQQKYDIKLMGEREQSLNKNDFKSGAALAGNFSSLRQEIRTWNSSNNITRCNSGCTPVAVAILMEYWDRNGYNKLISTAQDNNNTTTTDADIRWTINELRWNMRTYCTTLDGPGATSPSNSTRAIDHINSRNNGTWTTDITNSSLTRWSRLQGQINIGNPVLIHYDTTGEDGAANHSAVAYSYTDNIGSNNDSICVRTGWSGINGYPKSKCYVPINMGSYYVQRIMRP